MLLTTTYHLATQKRVAVATNEWSVYVERQSLGSVVVGLSSSAYYKRKKRSFAKVLSDRIRNWQKQKNLFARVYYTRKK